MKRGEQRIWWWINYFKTLLGVTGEDSDIDGLISDAAYSSSWNADTTHAASKNAIYDELNSVEVDLAAHEADGTIHFTEASIDHTAIQNIGTYTHAQVDSHIDDATIHFTEGSIDHGSIDATSLLDDDHTQYALLAGRTGGQTLSGSDTTAEDLTLEDNTTDGNTVTVSEILTEIDTSIHDNVASEISAVTAKGSPTSSDYLLIEDAADTNNKKSITIGDLPAAAPAAHAATHTNGTDDIQDATAAQKGLMTLAYAGKLDGIEAGADVTDATNVDAAGAVMEADFDANTILAATVDNTPVAVTIAEQRVLGRLTGGNITGLTLGIGNNNLVPITATTNANEYLKATSAGMTGRTYAEVRSDLAVADLSGTITANDIAKFSDSDTLIGRSYSETRDDLEVMSEIPFSIAIEWPQNDEDVPFIVELEENVVITDITARVQDGSSPSVTMQLLYGTSHASGSAICAATAVTNTTTGANITISTSDIAAGNQIWIVTSAMSGDPSWLGVTVTMKRDASP